MFVLYEIKQYLCGSETIIFWDVTWCVPIALKYMSGVVVGQ